MEAPIDTRAAMDDLNTNNLDTREWLLTNGLGSFASGTVCDAHTRTYHGWLFAALDPPSQRKLLLSRIDATLEIAEQQFELSTNFWQGGAIAPTGYQLLQSFQIDPVLTWVWSTSDWQFTRQLVMPDGLTTAGEPCSSILINYRYDGSKTALLKLRLLIGDRDFHHQQHANSELQFSQLIDPQRLLLQAQHLNWLGTPWQLTWTLGQYHPNSIWYRDYQYPQETQRGLGDREDLYSPGFLTATLLPGDRLTLEARVRYPDPVQPHGHLNTATFQQAVQIKQQRLDQQFAHLLPLGETATLPEEMIQWQRLLKAGDQFLVYRASIAGPTVIAGYHWFNDWGRDTLIALPGLTLTTKRFDLARGLLATFGYYCQYGLIPNAFPDTGARPFYNSIDAALWWIETLGLYLEASQDWAFLTEQYPIVRRIYQGFAAGTLHNIRVDAFDGLVSWDAPGVALTWMDAVIDGQPVTPRRGKAIEINALWYSALRWAGEWADRMQREANDPATTFGNQARRYAQQADQVKASLQKFWNAQQGYFYDVIGPDDRPDPAIRPNAVIALSLYHCGFPEAQARQVLSIARDRLLTPYGLRSLDPADANYIGHYAGNVQYRDRAYHQGTVWSWLIGPFIRAWQRSYPSEPLPFDGKQLLQHFWQDAGLESVSEIFDGDPPHLPQGAIAQAWSVAELIRHWQDLNFNF
jgi:predicted glycogen debranching enzyme